MTQQELQFLNELLACIPKRAPRRKDLLEIAGFPRWENVFSNLLAFYLDESEEHQFGRLFLEALFDVVQNRNGEWNEEQRFALPEEAYDVIREEGTSDRKRIDLLLRPKPSNSRKSLPKAEQEENLGWAILIENKIDANLYNNLGAYLNHVSAQKKLPIVLSLHTIHDPDEKARMKRHGFLNITHQELIHSVRNRLPQYLDTADDRHLLYLRDYFSAIQRLYLSPMEIQDMETTLAAFQEFREQIERLERESAKVTNYVTKTAIAAMGQLGYRCDTKYPAIGKHFYRQGSENKEEQNSLRIWLWLEGLRLRRFIIGYLELYGKATKQGEVVRNSLPSPLKDLPTIEGKGVTLGTRGSVGGPYLHLLRFNLDLNKEDGDLENRIHAALKRALIDSGYRDMVVSVVKGALH